MLGLSTLHPLFYNFPPDRSGKPGNARPEATQANTIVHELGRYYLYLMEERTGTIRDVYMWDTVVALLALY
jgi:hypothetical protein